jgi:thymidylate kinase
MTPTTAVDRFGAALRERGLNVRHRPSAAHGSVVPEARFLVAAADLAAAVQVLRSLPSVTVVDVDQRRGAIEVLVLGDDGGMARLAVDHDPPRPGPLAVGPRPVAAPSRMAVGRRSLARESRVHVALLGPDGAGKSTVLAAASERLRGVIPATRTVHLRPRVLRLRGGGEPVLEPHAKPPKPRWSSHLQLGSWWLEYRLDHVAALARGTRELRWSDRYVDDVLIDPRRYRYGGSMRFAAWIVERVPRPDLVVLLDAPAAVVHARKREVPVAETERQRSAYLAYVRALPNGRVVDASRPLDVVVGEVVGLVVTFLAERAAVRLESVRP